MNISSKSSGNTQTSANELPSRFSPGDLVTFNPHILIGQRSNVNSMFLYIPALVVGVKFEDGKVLYDLALGDEKDPTIYTNYHEVYPLCNVDSIFVDDFPSINP